MFQVLAVHHFYFLLRRQRLMPETSASWFFTVFKYSHISSQLILSIVLQLFQRGTPTLVLTGTSIPSYITWSILVDWLYNIEEIRNRWLMSYNIICVLFLALDYSFLKKNTIPSYRLQILMTLKLLSQSVVELLGTFSLLYDVFVYTCIIILDWL